MNLSFPKIDIKTALKNTSLVILGTLILAFATAVFIIPFDLVAGGVSGLGIILDKIIPIEFLTVNVIITILTWTVFFMGLFILGRAFAMKTLVSTVVYPPALSLFSGLVSPDVLGGFFLLGAGEEINLIVSSIFGGVFVGLGCAVTFIGGGSTGGTDILGFVAAKFSKRIKSSVAIGIIDGSVVLLGVFFLHNFVLTLLGILTVFISTIVIDKVFIGASKAFVAQIITDNYEEISNAIIHGIDRTTTIIDAVGGYSGRAQKMVVVSFSVRQYSELLSIINRYDKRAFLTIHRAHEINGEGWTR